jgi:outer membrane protein OmpA-like peptidoglycan-associated protein
VFALLVGVLLVRCASPPRPASIPVARLAQPAVLCADFDFTIYFDESSDQLTDAARLEIAYAAARVRGCALGAVEVVGLADASGAPRANLALSRRRAEAVARALAGAGLPAPTFKVEALGGAGALSPEGDPEPLRRRAEVVVRASPPPSRPSS